MLTIWAVIKGKGYVHSQFTSKLPPACAEHSPCSQEKYLQCIHTPPLPTEENLGKCNWSPWPIMSVWLDPLLRAWATFVSSKEVTKTCKMPPRSVRWWKVQKGNIARKISPLNTGKSSHLKMDELYLGNVRLSIQKPASFRLTRCLALVIYLDLNYLLLRPFQEGLHLCCVTFVPLST